MHTTDKSFWRGKLFSLFGIFPLGIYVIVHLYNNLTSFQGEQAFNEHLARGHALPFIAIIAVLVLWIPIFFHGIYGLFIAKKAKPNLLQFPFLGNLKYVLQRLSGLGLLFFIPAHIYKTRIEPGFLNSHLNFQHMAEGLSETPTFIIYILGVLGVAFHLANGVWQFSIGWGLVTSEKGMKKVQFLSYILFVILLCMGYGAIWGFRKTL